MMTEEEAKTKWCPFARVIAVTDQSPYMAGNRVKNHLQWPVETNTNPETATMHRLWVHGVARGHAIGDQHRRARWRNLVARRSHSDR